MKIFDNTDLSFHTHKFLELMPNSQRLYYKEEDGNLFKYSRGLTRQYVRSLLLINEWLNEINPKLTTWYLEEWEKVLGIPDDCFPMSSDVIKRQLYIYLKFISQYIIIKEDYIFVAQLLGVDIEVETWLDYDGFPITFPRVFADSGSPYIIVIKILSSGDTGFPIIFPRFFGESGLQILKCYLEKIKPPHCYIHYV